METGNTATPHALSVRAEIDGVCSWQGQLSCRAVYNPGVNVTAPLQNTPRQFT